MRGEKRKKKYKTLKLSIQPLNLCNYAWIWLWIEKYHACSSWSLSLFLTHLLFHSFTFINIWCQLCMITFSNFHFIFIYLFIVITYYGIKLLISISFRFILGTGRHGPTQKKKSSTGNQNLLPYSHHVCATSQIYFLFLFN